MSWVTGTRWPVDWEAGVDDPTRVFAGRAAAIIDSFFFVCPLLDRDEWLWLKRGGIVA